ncbi:IS630 transposase-related protein [Pseudoalteromonas fenneropenaei]|uniref:IS630 transposase-related protein n=1 Tax=Pseudoalteromonas fenneropenaei TaxID=1737459 RepID=A0ABV7CML9_9GAMM
MAYSLDFRRRVFAYKEKHHLTFEQTSEHFGVNIASLFRWPNKVEPCQNVINQQVKSIWNY